MFDTSRFDFSYRPKLQIEDNDGRFWIENDDEELEEYDGTNLVPGTGADDRTRIEYLGQVDVAAMTVESTLSDVLWVTMHRDGETYRIVFRSEIPDYDEIQTETPTFTGIPTFGEFLWALDHLSSDISDDLINGWVQGTIVGVTVSQIGSSLYPQLEEWYFEVQDHFFETGEMIYVDDPTGNALRREKLAEPNPGRKAEKTPGGGSIFASTPDQLKKLFGDPDTK